MLWESVREGYFTGWRWCTCSIINSSWRIRDRHVGPFTVVTSFCFYSRTSKNS